MQKLERYKRLETDLGRYVFTMLAGLVDHIDEIDIRETRTVPATESSPCVVELRIHVADSDKGKVIGKMGRTARSLRTIAGAAAQQSGIRVVLNISDRAEVG